MRRIRRPVGFVAVSVALVALLTSAVSGPTLHAQAAPSGWPIEVDESQRLDQLIAQPDGGVTLASCGYGRDSVDRPDFVSYNSSGTRTNGIATSRNRIDFCHPQGVAGKGGVMYGIEYMDDQTILQLGAYRGGKRLWALNLRQRCAGRDAIIVPHGLVAGSDGDLYLALQDECQQLSLMGISAAGKIKFTRLLGFSQAPSNEQLIKAYRDGVVLVQNFSGWKAPATFRHFDYAGRELTSRTYALRLQPEEQLNHWDVNYEGTVFAAPLRYNRDRPTPCNAEHLTERVFRRTTAGKTFVFDMRPHCMRVGQLKVTPGGGAVLVHDAEHFWAEHDTTMPLFFLTTDGKVRPHQLSANLSTDDATAVEGVSVAINGNVLVWRQIFRRHSSTHTSELTLLSPSGDLLARVHTDQFHNPDKSGEIYALKGEAPVLSTGAIYLTGCQRASLYASCNRDRYEVRRLRFIEASIEYPGGLMAGVKAPKISPINLVVLGDSYSSGEGVEPFDPKSDTQGNQCHRSQLAYGQLLAQDATLPIRLQKFVACSGAISAELIGKGQYGEDAQIKAITKDTKAVILTIGGNDADFENLAIACISPIEPTGCTGKRLEETLGNIRRELENKLYAKFTEVRKHITAVGSAAKVYVLGYPMLVPPKGEREFVGPGACRYLSDAEADTVITVINRLNQAARLQATRSGVDFNFVSATEKTSPFRGHELCNKGGVSYFNGPQLPVAYSYHPNAKGQQAYATLMEGVLRKDFKL